MIALVSVAAVALVPATDAVAAAYPVKDKTLTENALYKTGALPVTACREKPIKKLDPKTARSYLNGVLACLDRTWAKQMKKAGLRWSRPKVVYVTKAPARFCGNEWEDSVAYYCYSSRTVELLLGKEVLEEPDDLFLFNLMAELYAEHMQNSAGIVRALDKLPYRNEAEAAEQDRRYNLQNICFGTAFIASVWKSLDRGRDDWDDLLSYMRTWAGKHDGSKKSISYWAGQGFVTGNLAACNTWTAPSAKVV